MKTSVSALALFLAVSFQPGSARATDAVLHRILAAEHARNGADKFLQDSIRYSANRETNRRAILAAARIGTPELIEPLSAVLNQNKHPQRNLAAFALGLNSDPKAVVLLTQNLPLNTDASFRAALLLAIGRAGGEKQLALFDLYLKEGNPPRVIAAAAEGLGNLLTGDSAKWPVTEGTLRRLLALASQPGEAALPAAFALARYKGSPLLSVGEYATAVAASAPSATSKDRYVQAFLLRAAARSKNKEWVDLATQYLSPSIPANARYEIARGLAGIPAGTAGLWNAFSLALNAPEAGVKANALEAVGGYGSEAAAVEPILKKLLAESPSLWVQTLALKAWAKVNPTAARNTVHHLIQSPKPLLAAAACQAAATLGEERDFRALLAKLSTPDPLSVSSAVEGLKNHAEKKVLSDLKDRLLEIATKGRDVAVLTSLAELSEAWAWEDGLKQLAPLLPQLSSINELEAKLTLLSAIGSLGLKSQTEVLKQLVADPERLVGKAAADALKKITGEDLSDRVAKISPASTALPPASEISDALRRRLRLRTTRGEIVLELSRETPLTAHQLVALSAKGFYNGKLFHRVVPGFVAQGGDPRGDGYGGPGAFLRDEVTPDRHSPFSVGIATAGKDTGGSQFFINTGQNLHLAGRYTNFGRVVSGFAAAEALEIGDKILGLEIIANR